MFWTIFWAVIMVIGGFVLLVKGADWFVDGAAGLAAKLRIPQLVIGLTIVALGTSLPELVTSVTAAKKGNADIAIGNIVGSNLFNILFVLGTSALIIPLNFEASFAVDTIIAIATGVLLWVATFKSKKLTRPWAIVMLACYAVYFVYLLV